mmetsp:Transcript_89175/g.252843  ORF Transcript_89175/g.252843 Transcript_89175/m.252843 type:complete len:245 (-) Transcript_89175:86-820(-)
MMVGLARRTHACPRRPFRRQQQQSSPCGQIDTRSASTPHQASSKPQTIGAKLGPARSSRGPQPWSRSLSASRPSLRVSAVTSRKGAPAQEIPARPWQAWQSRPLRLCSASSPHQPCGLSHRSHGAPLPMPSRYLPERHMPGQWASVEFAGSRREPPRRSVRFTVKPLYIPPVGCSTVTHRMRTGSPNTAPSTMVPGSQLGSHSIIVMDSALPSKAFCPGYVGFLGSGASAICDTLACLVHSASV